MLRAPHSHHDQALQLTYMLQVHPHGLPSAGIRTAGLSIMEHITGTGFHPQARPLISLGQWLLKGQEPEIALGAHGHTDGWI